MFIRLFFLNNFYKKFILFFLSLFMIKNVINFITTSQVYTSIYIYIIICTNRKRLITMRVLSKISPLVVFLILSSFFDWVSLCDDGSSNSPSDLESLDSNSSLTEEEKNLEKRDELIVKIGTGVIICTIIINIVLYYVLIYSKTN